MAKVFEKAVDTLKGLTNDANLEIHSQAEITRAWLLRRKAKISADIAANGRKRAAKRKEPSASAEKARDVGATQHDKENESSKPAAKRRGRAAKGKSTSPSCAGPRDDSTGAEAETSPERPATAPTENEEQPNSSGKKNTRAERAKARAAAAPAVSNVSKSVSKKGKTSPSPSASAGPSNVSPAANVTKKEGQVIEIDLVSPPHASTAKTPGSMARSAKAEPSSRGPTTRSASKSVSDEKKLSGRAAAAKARGAGVTPGPVPAVANGRTADGGANTPVAYFSAKTPKCEKSFGKKLAAVANEKPDSPMDTTGADTDVPLFSNSLFETQGMEGDGAQKVAMAKESMENTEEVPEEVAATQEEDETPQLPPPLPKLAPDLMTSFVPLAGYEEGTTSGVVSGVVENEKTLDDSAPVDAAPSSGKKPYKTPGSGHKIKALQQAEAAKKAETQREEERQKKKRAMIAERQAAQVAAKPVASVSQQPVSTNGGAAAGSVMERLQRAMESRSRLEAENRAKLESDTKRKEEERVKREQETEHRKRQKELDDAKEREEKRARTEKMLKMRKEQEDAQREVEEKQARVKRLLEEQERGKMTQVVGVKRSSALIDGAAENNSAEEKKRRLQDFMANNRANAALAAGATGNAVTPNGVKAEVKAKVKVNNAPQEPTGQLITPKPASQLPGAPAEFSYQISPYRENSDSESEEDDAGHKKPIPEWATSEQLAPCLYRQAKVDPDEIFVNPSKTCSLDLVFTNIKNKKNGRRSSSGNWFHDRLTWKEEVSYKREMGFVTSGGGCR